MGKWSLENLPIFPETFRYEVPMDKRAQFSIVKRELQSADTIIIATDGDREGEAIAWSIIRQANAFSKEKNYLRLWINSLEKKQSMKVLRISNLERTIFQNIKKRKQGRTLIG